MFNQVLFLLRSPFEKRETMDRLILMGRSWVEEFDCAAIELPWKDNKRRVSRIPAGQYVIERRSSKNLGEHFIILGVPGRDLILFHVANFVRQLEGCIAPGLTFVDLDGDGLPDVASSRKAMDWLLKLVKTPCRLVVVDPPGVE